MTAALVRTDKPSGDEVNERIRRTVRALRSAYGVDAETLAAHLGIGRNTMYSRLKGRAPFLAAEIVALAHFFGCEIMDFYTGNVRISQNGPVPDGDGSSGIIGVTTRA